MKETCSVIEEIIAKLASLDIQEKRSESKEYCEFVFSNMVMPELERIFTGFFGPAAKTKSKEPSKEDAMLAEKYGGIYAGQTLFRKDKSGFTVIAMFWPWQSEPYTTVKVFLQKTPSGR